MSETNPLLNYAIFRCQTTTIPSSFVLPGNVNEILNDETVVTLTNVEERLFERYITCQDVSEFDPSLVFYANSPRILPTEETEISIPIQEKENEDILKANQEEIINEMISRTSAEKDVCAFFLESCNWDLESAILMQSMSS